MKRILIVFFLSSSLISYCQEIKVKPGLTYGYSFQAITNPKVDSIDLKRFAAPQVRLNLGPSLTLGTVKTRLSLNVYGFWFVQSLRINNPNKSRNAFGYGGSASLYITPRKVNPNHYRTGLRKDRTAEIGYRGFFAGIGWEDLKSVYKIPKENSFNNFRFSTVYGKVGVSTFSAIKSTDFFLKYGYGQQNSHVWEIGNTWTL